MNRIGEEKEEGGISQLFRPFGFTGLAGKVTLIN